MMSPRQRMTQSFRYPFTGMSAKTFLSLAAGTIALIAGLAGFARFVGSLDTKARADSAYVSRAEWAGHQADEQLRYQRDSITNVGALRDIFRTVSGLDSSDKCRRHMTAYCR